MKDKWQTASKLLLAPLTKWLFNQSGVPLIADVAAGAVDLAAKHLDNPAAPSIEQRLNALAGQILKQHAAQFDYENVAIDAAAVGKALATALEALSKRPVEKILEQNLDPARLLKLAEKENAGAALSEADKELFAAALPALIKAVVDIAPELKGFAGTSTREILTRIDKLTPAKAGLCRMGGGVSRPYRHRA